VVGVLDREHAGDLTVRLGQPAPAVVTGELLLARAAAGVEGSTENQPNCAS
jgi:hypothetical protein